MQEKAEPVQRCPTAGAQRQSRTTLHGVRATRTLRLPRNPGNNKCATRCCACHHCLPTEPSSPRV
eukprot:14769594-Alexandrium_andersonii.AAC.1